MKDNLTTYQKIAIWRNVLEHMSAIPDNQRSRYFYLFFEEAKEELRELLKQI